MLGTPLPAELERYSSLQSKNYSHGYPLLALPPVHVAEVYEDLVLQEHYDELVQAENFTLRVFNNQFHNYQRSWTL